MFELILFVVGLALGSFLNVLIDRLPSDESIVYPPSHCDNCKKKLAWYDLIPVFSFLVLQGKCRYCKKAISWQYPIVELLTGILFSAVILYKGSLGEWGNLFYYLFIISSFIVIFFTDLKYGIIPDKVVFPAIVIAFIFLISQYPNILISHLLSALGAFLFFLAIFLVTRGRGMGFGDVKFSFLLGLLFGFPKIVLALYVAFLTGAFFSIILLVLRRKRFKETIVFGPFLVLGSLLTLFFGDSILQLWFLPLFILR